MRPVVTFLVVVSIVAVGGLYLFLRGPGGTSGTAEAEPRRFELEIAKVVPIDGLPMLQAKQGDPVTLIVSSEQTGTLHLHGYEKLMELTPGAQQTLEFVAARAGWFPIGLHDPAGNETTVTALQVDPR